MIFHVSKKYFNDYLAHALESISHSHAMMIHFFFHFPQAQNEKKKWNIQHSHTNVTRMMWKRASKVSLKIKAREIFSLLCCVLFLQTSTHTFFSSSSSSSSSSFLLVGWWEILTVSMVPSCRFIFPLFALTFNSVRAVFFCVYFYNIFQAVRILAVFHSFFFLFTEEAKEQKSERRKTNSKANFS
jgi:ABC-type transport system involved in cytochrome c biogenesis permease subunit